MKDDPSLHSGAGLRSDIQALRGLAILLVVLHHGQLVPGLRAGYLGVDVFFVVSGFLITGIIVRAIQAGRFSFVAFYTRRAWRLLPAAYVSFFFCLLAAPAFLTPAEMRDFVWQLIGAVTFTANVTLWMQTGYFEAAASLKPLLHVWSLSIEEQYYALIPLALVLIPQRLWKPSLLLLGTLSLALCLLLVDSKPGATFYLLPTRAWELAIGSLGALAASRFSSAAWLAVAFWPAIATLILLPFFPISSAHPGFDALLVCMATLVVILRRHDRAQASVLLGPLVWLGNISYSLYLVHWPLLAFTASAFVSPVPEKLRAALLIAATGIAWALHRWIEEPFRSNEWRRSRSALLALGLFTLALPAAGGAIVFSQHGSSASEPAYARRANYGLDPTCDAADGLAWREACVTSATPSMLLWGDSYAMHIAEGLAASGADELWQATKSACGPLQGISMYVERSLLYNEAWARDCIAFNAEVLDVLRSKPSVDVVVLASLFDQYLDGYRIIRKSENGIRDEQGSLDAAASALIETVDAVRAIGKRVVVVAPPPASAAGVDLGRCTELLRSRTVIWGADHFDCSIDEAAYRRARNQLVQMLVQVAKGADVEVYWPHDALCTGGVCSVKLDGVPLYRDAGHFSYDGSRQFGIRYSLAQTLEAMAR